MQIKLFFSDPQDARQSIKWYAKDYGLNLDIEVLKSFVIHQCREALEKLNIQEFESIITITVKSISDDSTNFLAFYSPLEITDSKSHHFYSYLPTVLDFYKQHVHGIKEDDHQIKNVWLHELVHFIDHRELRRDFELLSFFLEEPISLYNYNNIKVKNDFFWSLQLLTKFRCEGIATFIEEIFDNRTEDLWILDAKIRKDFNNVLQNAHLEGGYSQNEANLTYAIGKNIILNCLYYKDPVKRPIYKKVEEKISRGLNIDIEDFDGISIQYLISQLIEITTEDMIFILVQQKVPLPFAPTLDTNIVSYIIRLFNNKGDGNEIAEAFHQIVNNSTSTKYLGLKTLIGNRLTDIEIETNYSDKISTINKNSCFYKLLKDSYERWRTTLSELEAWKLSYVFDDYDAINDNIPIIGNLDDMLILDS